MTQTTNSRRSKLPREQAQVRVAGDEESEALDRRVRRASLHAERDTDHGRILDLAEDLRCVGIDFPQKLRRFAGGCSQHELARAQLGSVELEAPCFALAAHAPRPAVHAWWTGEPCGQSFGEASQTRFAGPDSRQSALGTPPRAD